MKMVVYKVIERQALDFWLMFDDKTELKVSIDECDCLFGRARDKRDFVQLLGSKIEEQVRDGTARGKKKWDEVCAYDMTNILRELSSR